MEKTVLDVYNEELAKQKAEYDKKCAELEREHNKFMDDFMKQIEEQQQADLKAFEEMLKQ